jgi:hypothetical protein
MNGSWLS